MQIAEALFSRTLKAVLGILFSDPEKSYHLRDIVRRSGLGQGQVQRDLKRLTEAGVLTRAVKGRMTSYQPNPACPVFPELKGLVVKTIGVVHGLRSALEPLSKDVRVAFIYGSFARGTENSGSDVDLMIIGKVTLRRVVGALQGVQEAVGREINPTVYSPEEYRRKLTVKHHFLTALRKEPKIFLIGDEDELGRLG